MKKNLCFINILVDEKTDNENECNISIFDREELSKTLNNFGDYTLDLIHYDVESKIIKEQEKIENFIILNKINQKEINEKNAKHLIVRCFRIIKCMMPIIMQNKGSRIWLVHCFDDEVGDKSYKNVMHHSLKEGFLSLTRVFAMELAKRRINVNFVKMKNLNSWANFEQFMKNLSHCSPFNMTAQEIKIEE